MMTSRGSAGLPGTIGGAAVARLLHADRMSWVARSTCNRERAIDGF
jgi:hypothetical protein